MTDSFVRNLTQQLLALWRRVVASSAIVQTRNPIRRRTSNAFKNSMIFQAFDVHGRWTRATWLYRWLTAGLDPDVIVINLRETYTLGPILAVIDRLGNSRMLV